MARIVWSSPRCGFSTAYIPSPWTASPSCRVYAAMSVPAASMTPNRAGSVPGNVAASAITSSSVPARSSSTSPTMRTRALAPLSTRVSSSPTRIPVECRNALGTTTWPGPVYQLPAII